MNRMLIHALGLSAGLLLASSAWGAAGHDGLMAQAASAELPVSSTVTASGCWIRQIPAPAPSGGFLVIHNAGTQPAVLNGVSSPDYGMVMMHETTQKNGMSRMSMVHQVTVPAGGQLELKPGSYHLMLEKARDGLKVGDQVRVDFTLADGQRLSAQCEIQPARAMPGMRGHMKY